MASSAARSWYRHVTSRSVQAKIRRANEFFLGLHGDRNVCLCCADFMQTSSTVTLLCGHEFHTSCLNDWHRRHSLTTQEQSSNSFCLRRRHLHGIQCRKKLVSSRNFT